MLGCYSLGMKIFLTLCLLSISVSADVIETVVSPASGLWGLGAKVKASPYVEADLEYSVAPYIFGSYGFLNIEANRADITLYGNGLVFASVVGQYRSQEARKESSPYGERKAALELGGQVGLVLPASFVLRASYLWDLSNAHNGSELDVQLFRHDGWGDLFLLTSVGLQYQSKKLTNYYYAYENYEPREALSAELELIVTYKIGDYGLFLGSRNYFYGSEITNSPIVDKAYNLQLFSGIGYQF